MLGQMMHRPLLIQPMMAYAAAYHGDQELVTRCVEGGIHRYTYRAAYARMGQLANALTRLGVKPHDRIGTVAWNTHRHFELYYAVAGIGAVCHTINPRLFHDQLTYIVNHAADRFLFVDLTFVPILEKLAPHLKGVEAYVILTDGAHMPQTTLHPVLCYEELLAPEDGVCEWPEFDENTAAALCYTSGTTGNPKGALYSHRSTVIHALSIFVGADGRWLTTKDSLLLVVPMFHVSAWGFPFMAPIAGTKLVFPGADYSGQALHELLAAERVTFTAGVPTVWIGLLGYLREHGLKLTTLTRMLCGGTAPPEAMMREFEQEHGVEFIQGWGMTETSPVGSLCVLPPAQAALPDDARYRLKRKQGRAPFGYDMRIVGDDGAILEHDGTAAGELQVRGNWVISGYFRDEAATRAAMDLDGWFRTGDVASIDAQGFMEITDRTKDLIKSGGEWISSIALENSVIGHPDVSEAAAIARPHPKWGERPLLVVVPKAGRTPSKESVLAYLKDKVAPWWLPDDVVVAADLPHTATGKVSKAQLRDRFKDHVLPTA
ncbi:MAG: long-chain-fatty-acid--CoA ligase [Alphaproteobacteria bacterium]|nr:long-chain-fatty-acid--CoA ligase [Alphaproteobacteria bacterium]